MELWSIQELSNQKGDKYMFIKDVVLTIFQMLSIELFRFQNSISARLVNSSYTFQLP